MKNIFKEKRALVAVVIIVAALLVFQAGVFVGYHKALFSYRGGERYIRMIEGPRGQGMMEGFAGFMGLPSDDLSPSHGAAGKIVSVSLPSFVVAAPDNSEKTVVVGDDTVIRLYRNTASTTAIQPDQYVVVLGEPDDAGAIDARFIRIMPPPPSAPATASSSSSR